MPKTYLWKLKERDTMADRKGKIDVVNEIASVTGLTKTVITQVIDAKLDVIKDWVSSGKEVVFVGFGTYCTGSRSARTGRNPQTGKTINIPASKVPKFKPGKAFKDVVNTKK